jgi:hypothetical protein
MIMSLLEYTARRVGIVPLPRGTGAGKHALFLLFLSIFSRDDKRRTVIYH